MPSYAAYTYTADTGVGQDLLDLKEQAVNMGNKTIYVKDEALWDRAKELAGKEGFSAVIAQALADFVERKADEHRGLTDYRLPIGDELICWRGRLLTSTVLGLGNQRAGELEVYQTKAGKLVVVAGDLADAFGYEVYETLEQFANSGGHLRDVPDPEGFVEEVSEAMGQNPTVWID